MKDSLCYVGFQIPKENKMTYFDISNWSITDGKQGLLLFAQAMEELISPHSHDSHKAPILNFHVICFEIKAVISLIDEDVLDKGNLIPLISEMKSLFSSDIIAQQILGNDFNMLLAKKNAKGEYELVPSNVEKSKDIEPIIPILRKSTDFIISELERNEQYYSTLKNEIRTLIQNNPNSIDRLSELNTLTRIFASELINRGFSQTYIYDCIKIVFFTNSDVHSFEVIDDFFSFFTSEKKNYTVYMPINSIKQKNALDKFGALSIAENVYEMFRSASPYVLKYSCKQADPYKAREEALELINFCLSVNQFIMHNKYDYNPLHSEVVDNETKEVFSITRPELPITRGYLVGNNMEVRELLETCFNTNQSVFQVLQLHSTALTSKNTGNQIINLWTAVEVAIPVVRKEGLSRINQICNVLTTTLSISYFSVLIQQLAKDIDVMCPDCKEIIESIEYDSSDYNEKLLAVIVLQEFLDKYNKIITLLLEKTPVLACRLERERYKKQWENTEAIANTYKKHCIRLSQQIMRIYRTRNMLVHDGTEMPYSEYILQNLHYYIDSFVMLIHQYHGIGYYSVQDIIEATHLQEQRYLSELKTNNSINKDNFIKFICGLPCK